MTRPPEGWHLNVRVTKPYRLHGLKGREFHVITLAPGQGYMIIQEGLPPYRLFDSEVETIGDHWEGI